MNMRKWVKLPSAWMEQGGLKLFRWGRGAGAAETAALMALLGLAHRADLDTGIAKATYDDLTTALALSRTTLADGLEILSDRGLIIREPIGRSTFELVNYGVGHAWAAIPASPLYPANGTIPMFDDFHLRKPAELNALKIYLGLAARRDHRFNVTWMTYDQMADYTGIDRKKIKQALGILAVNGLITVDPISRQDGMPGAAHGYRLTHLYPSRHGGTTGRADLGVLLDPL